MMENDQVLEESFNNATTHAGFDQGSALRMRLDTRPLIEDIEMFLKAETVVVAQNKETGQIQQYRKVNGTPLANQEGIQTILTMVTAIINPSIVQGNMPEEEAKRVARDLKMMMAYQLMINAKKWKIQKSKRFFLNRTLESMIYVFLTRTVNNLERDSYNKSMQTVERNTVQDGNKGFKLFGGRSDGN